MGCRKVSVVLPYIRQGNIGKPRIPERERELQKEMEDLGIITVSQIIKWGASSRNREDAPHFIIYKMYLYINYLLILI